MIRVVVDDLAFLATDAIVRPATVRLDSTTPAVRRLEQAGGSEFLDHIRVRKDLVVGAAVVTGAGGDLPAEFVIHAVIQSDTEPVSRTGVERAWRSALERAREWEFARLTAPVLGTGAGNLTIEDAAAIMGRVARSHASGATFPDDVCIVVETAAELATVEAVLRTSASS